MVVFIMEKNNVYIYSSEKYHLQVLNCIKIKKLNREAKIFDIPKHENINIHIKEYKIKRVNLVPK